MRALSPPLAAWAAVTVLLAISFGIDVWDVSLGGSIDLRNRVTGARLLLAGIDPYFYKWQEPQPATFCDPYNNPKLPVSKTTATPALLLADALVALLPYRAGQFSWLILQWLLLLGTAWIWLRRRPRDLTSFILAAFVTGFTYMAAWRLHAERGQSYVLLLCLFAGWLAGTLSPESRRPFFTGLLAGILVAFRPPFLLLAPFILLHRRAQIWGGVAGLLIAFVLPTLWQHDAWQQYSSAMELHSALYRNGIDPRPGPERFPAEIEGMPTDLLANYLSIPYADFSLHSLLRSIGLEPFPGWPPLVLAAGAFGIWLWKSRGRTMFVLLLELACWMFVMDLFIPAYRNNYNDVMILNVVALATIGRIQEGVLPCFLAVPLGWCLFFLAPHHDWLTNAPSFCFMLSAIALLFVFNSEIDPRKLQPSRERRRP